MADKKNAGSQKDVKVVTNPSGAVVATNTQTGKVVIIKPKK